MRLPVVLASVSLLLFPTIYVCLRVLLAPQALLNSVALNPTLGVVSINPIALPKWTEAEKLVKESTISAVSLTREASRDAYDDWTLGLPAESFSQAFKYWQTEFDFEKTHAAISCYPHFKATFDKKPSVHFVHVTGIESAAKCAWTQSIIEHQSTQADSCSPHTPIDVLMLLHGWPGSVHEYTSSLIPALYAAHPCPSRLHVVAPSMPGYGWSEVPKTRGMSAVRVAELFGRLMEGLGYGRYRVHGGDWGGIVGTAVAQLFPDKVSGFHTTFAPSMKPMAVIDTLIGEIPGFGWWPYGLTASDKSVIHGGLIQLVQRLIANCGYLLTQATRPTTLGHMVNQHPASLLAWMLEKYWFWTVPQPAPGSPDLMGSSLKPLTDRLQLDEVLTQVTIYLATGSMPSSMMLYKETIFQPEYSLSSAALVEVPTYYMDCPNEVSRMPAPWLRYSFRNLIHYRSGSDCGHFVSLEDPQQLTESIMHFIEMTANASASKNVN